MRRVLICIFALLLAVMAFAEEGSQDKSHYFGGRFAFGFGYVWDNEPVKGTFGSAKDGVSKNSLGGGPGFNLGLGASYWFHLNCIIGFVGEAEFRWGYITLDGDAYSLPPEDEYDDEVNFTLDEYGFVFPILVRFFPTPKFYLEAGPQFNLNLGGSISDENADESSDFDVEGLGWALVLGFGCPTLSNGNGLTFGVRFVMDMTRIEKDGIVEMTKGAAYREASPMKLWSLQFSATVYFL